MTALSTSQPMFVRAHQRGRRSSCLGGPLDVSDAANFVQCGSHADDLFTKARPTRAEIFRFSWSGEAEQLQILSFEP